VGEHAGVEAPRPGRAARLAGVAGAAAVLVAVVGGYRARGVDIRRFDADEVADLETEMWRSYYDRRRLLLFRQLVTLLRRQFRLPPLRSVVLAGLAARAAAVFQVGASRADYERALPLLDRYYASIRAASTVPFDPREAARLELEWWIVHREAGGVPSPELERALAAVAAELYQVPAERLGLHARRRAEAMLLRDRQAAAGGVTAEGWQRIAVDLREAWGSLHAVVAT